jgi:gluconate 5-dehydrogenase
MKNTTEQHVMNLFSLKGKVAIVTGACGWLGAAMSRALAEAGARVVATSRTQSQAVEFATTLSGHGHLGICFSQDDTDSIPSFVSSVIEQMGQIDILVNNAYGGPAPDIESATADDFNRAYHTGVTGYFLLARDVARHLRARQCPGSIINIGSMYGLVASYPSAYEGVPANSPPNYHALKGGIVHLTRHLAAYWAKDNIRVNTLSPGPFPKPAVRDRAEGMVERLEEKVPLGRMGRPEELKGAVVLLASNAGSYITGQNLLVDGGWTAW